MNEIQELESLREQIKVLELLDVENSKTTQDNDKIQEEFELRLQDLANKISKEKKAGKTMDEMRTKHLVEVRAMIDKFLQDSYLNGKSYVGKSHKTFIPISHQDISLLEKLSIKYETRFWALIEHAEFDTANEFLGNLLGNFVSMFVSDAVTDTINSSSLITLGQTKDLEKILAQELPAGEFVFSTDELEVQFTTRRDHKVCPICEPLDGRRFKMDDTSKPNIPEDTHPNCRCRYLEVRNGKAING